MKHGKMEGKNSNLYYEICEKNQDLIFKYTDKSAVMGFDYLFSTSPRSSSFLKKITTTITNIFKLGPMLKYIGKMNKGMNESFSDLKPYYEDLRTKKTHHSDENKEINTILWKELLEYARENWGIIKVGFTEVPNDLIFQNKSILFKYSLIFIQEMDKKKIDQAPGMQAGSEVMRVYADLGIAVNFIARWLRNKGIKCQSNHPAGGLTLTPPLAGMAGMGWQGLSGNLITREFGTRQRIAAIFIQDKVFEFTDNEEHRWIEKFCAQCGNCKKNCPAGAIHGRRDINIDNIPYIGAVKTCIDAEKCFPMFLKKNGCSICLKVCPFSAGPEVYDKLKAKFA